MPNVCCIVLYNAQAFAYSLIVNFITTEIYYLLIGQVHIGVNPCPLLVCQFRIPRDYLLSGQSKVRIKSARGLPNGQ
jgi:hypothetical protein